MQLSELDGEKDITLLYDGGTPERILSEVYCCDLLSHAMSHAPAGSAWVTVTANENTLAAAKLREVSCVIFAEGIFPSPELTSCAKEHGIAVAKTELPVYQAARQIDDRITGGD